MFVRGLGNLMVEADGEIEVPSPANSIHWLFDASYNFSPVTSCVAGVSGTASNVGSSAVGSGDVSLNKPVVALQTLATFLESGYWGGTNWKWGTTNPTFNVQALTDNERALARQAFHSWSTVTNLTFTEVTSGGNIVFSSPNSGTDSNSAYADFAGSAGTITSASVNIGNGWMSAYYDTSRPFFNYAYQTYLHEIGHALGLGHQGPYNGSATYGVDNAYANDSWQFSLMSYFGQDNYDYNGAGASYLYISGPMMADILAMHDKYGASATKTHWYGDNADRGAEFDFANGVRSFTMYSPDGWVALNSSNYSGSQIIHMNAGQFSSVRGYVNNVGNYSPMTSYVGGSGVDDITGSDSADTIFAMNDDDVIYSGLANDTVDGGGGADVLLGDGAIMPTENAMSIYRLYLATLDRSPDDAGWANWVTQLNAGTSLQTIANGFVNSAEFQLVYGSQSNTQFVTLLYSNVLHRAPDATGLANWVASLDAGNSRASVVVGFSESVEFKKTSDPEAHAGQIYRLYGAALDRSPDAGGFIGWTGALDNNLPLDDAANAFVNSPEFKARYGSLNDTQYVTLLYNTVLHRAPDSSGLAHWVDLLSSGTSRSSVLLGFSESAEYVAGTTPSLYSYMRTVQPTWNDVLTGGSGNDTISGGHGADTYIFHPNEGTDQVYRYEAWDTVKFTGFGYASAAAAISHMTQSGADVVFSDQASVITFHGATLAQLQAGYLLVA